MDFIALPIYTSVSRMMYRVKSWRTGLHKRAGCVNDGSLQLFFRLVGPVPKMPPGIRDKQGWI